MMVKIHWERVKADEPSKNWIISRLLRMQSAQDRQLSHRREISFTTRSCTDVAAIGAVRPAENYPILLKMTS